MYCSISWEYTSIIDKRNLGYLIFRWNFKITLKYNLTLTGEFNLTLSKLLNAHGQLFSVSVLNAHHAVLQQSDSTQKSEVYDPWFDHSMFWFNNIFLI